MNADGHGFFEVGSRCYCSLSRVTFLASYSPTKIIQNVLAGIVLAGLLSSCATDYSEHRLQELEVVRLVDIQDQSETVTAEARGHKIKAVVRLRPFTQQDVQDHSYWLGVDGGLPEQVVERIEVQLDGEKLFIPHRVYSNFGAFPCEPQQQLVQMFGNADRLVVRYSGSDGAGAYEAEFHFKDRRFDRAIIPEGARKVVRR